jgi:hypothetical protein
MDETVWVLVIDHRYGYNHYVNKTNEGMLNALAEYCREWWSDLDLNEGSMPSDRGELIDKYFENVYQEWYTCDLVTVHE